ncbi:putative reverse transcriptase domain-containing protein [Tanacetum coccineum]
MTKLTQKAVKFDWGDKQEAAFQLLKQKLCSAPILALPEGSKYFIVYCDVSHKGLGAVLMQREKEISYASRQLEIHEKNYTNHELNLDEGYTGGEVGTMCGWNSMLKRKELVALIWPTFPPKLANVMTCTKVKAEHHRPSGLLVQPEIPQWKWDNITIDFFTKLPNTTQKIVTHLDGLLTYLLSPATFDHEGNESHGETSKNVPKGGSHEAWIPVSIICDRDPRFASNFRRSLQKEMGTSLDMCTVYHPQNDEQSKGLFKLSRICCVLV